MSDELVEYAYLCNACLTILEIPCFVDGKCPLCGGKSKEILYMKKIKLIEFENDK